MIKQSALSDLATSLWLRVRWSSFFVVVFVLFWLKLLFTVVPYIYNTYGNSLDGRSFAIIFLLTVFPPQVWITQRPSVRPPVRTSAHTCMHLCWHSFRWLSRSRSKKATVVRFQRCRQRGSTWAKVNTYTQTAGWWAASSSFTKPSKLLKQICFASKTRV